MKSPNKNSLRVDSFIAEHYQRFKEISQNTFKITL